MAIQHWSNTAADNDDADATINWAEGQTAASVNNSARAMMKVIADWRDALGGAKTTGGAADAYTLTTGLSLTAYVNGFELGCEASFTNAGPATINIDGLGTKPLRTSAGAAFVGGEVVSGSFYKLGYESGADVVLVTNATAPIAATLTAIAALAVTDGNIIVGNGSTWVAESGATARASLGLTIGTHVQAFDAELAALAGLTSAADKVPYFTGSGTAALADLTSFGRSIIDDANEAAFKATVNLEAGIDFAAIPTTGQLPVGAIAFMRYNSNTEVANGGTTSGSNLDLAVGLTSDFGTGGTTQTGTWMNISGLAQDNNGFVANRGYWVRTA